MPLPLGVRGDLGRVPRPRDQFPGQELADVAVLDKSEVLDQAAQGHRRRRVGLGQAGRIQAAALPGELRARALEREEQDVGLAGCHRRFVDRGVQGDVLGHARMLGSVPDVLLPDCGECCEA